jgi:hypothetical protein
VPADPPIDQDGALAVGQDEDDIRPFTVTVTADGNQRAEYRTAGQVSTEAIVAQTARHGGTALAVLDFDAADED